MGQRFQAYIRTINPVIRLEEKLKNSDNVFCKLSLKNKESLVAEIGQFKKAFGSEPTTVLGYYNQWCYGRAALLASANILTFNAHATDRSSPFNIRSQYEGKELITVITHILSILNSQLAQKLGRFGIENFELLNFNQPEIREDFRGIDNNDGIVVIDTITNKYAFVNVGSGDTTISQIKSLEPISASRYLKLYYPECASDSKTLNTRGKTKDEIDSIYENNKSSNLEYTELFKGFEVLTTEELTEIFPKCFKSKKLTNNKNQINGHEKKQNQK